MSTLRNIFTICSIVAMPTITVLVARAEPARVPATQTNHWLVCINDESHCALTARSAGETARANWRVVRAVTFKASAKVEAPIMMLHTRD